MTPLALQLLEQFTKPTRLRDVFDTRGVLRLVPRAHCFELSEVHELAEQLAVSMLEYGTPRQRMAFLPAPVTIIEWWAPNAHDLDVVPSIGDRIGYMLVEMEGGEEAEVFAIGGNFASGPSEVPNEGAHLTFIGRLGLTKEAEMNGVPSNPSPEQLAKAKSEREARGNDADADRLFYAHMKAMMYARLALINTPRVIGRRQHMPERALQKKIAFASGMKAGKFPLQAWTEIKLEVTPPRDAGGEAPRETHLTGGKAMHFCRSHLRVQNGYLTLVRAHWRGDPALGIKRSRYRLTQGSGGHA